MRVDWSPHLTLGKNVNMCISKVSNYSFKTPTILVENSAPLVNRAFKKFSLEKHDFKHACASLKFERELKNSHVLQN